jgi:Reverse transcriptase (RNA-dependent DNA polymerase)
MRTGFFLGELNGLSYCAADIGNAYSYSCTREKVYVIEGPEFGSDLEGQTLLIYKALYGLRTSAACFHKYLSEQLIMPGFNQSNYDHDLWIKDKVDHYEHLATFVDDVLVWSKDPMAIMSELKKIYVLKGVGTPEYYIGGNVEILNEHWVSIGWCRSSIVS